MSNKDKRVEITGLKIKLEKIDLELSLQEARKLYDVLGELFEKETIIEKVKEYLPSPYPYRWYYPYKYSTGDQLPWNDRYTIWYDGGIDNQTLNITLAKGGDSY